MTYIKRIFQYFVKLYIMLLFNIKYICIHSIYYNIILIFYMDISILFNKFFLAFILLLISKTSIYIYSCI